jgi:hypothetical protein
MRSGGGLRVWTKGERIVEVHCDARSMRRASKCKLMILASTVIVTLSRERLINDTAIVASLLDEVAARSAGSCDHRNYCLSALLLIVTSMNDRRLHRIRLITLLQHQPLSGTLHVHLVVLLLAFQRDSFIVEAGVLVDVVVVVVEVVAAFNRGMLVLGVCLNVVIATST